MNLRPHFFWIFLCRADLSRFDINEFQLACLQGEAFDIVRKLHARGKDRVPLGLQLAINDGFAAGYVNHFQVYGPARCIRLGKAQIFRIAR